MPRAKAQGMPPLQRRKAAALTALGAILAIAGGIGLVAESRSAGKGVPPMGADNVVFHDVMMGEALLHDAPRAYDQDDMPLDSVSAAMIFSRLGADFALWEKFVAAATAAAILAVAMANSASPFLAGGLSLGIFALAVRARDDFLTAPYNDAAFALCVLLVAAFTALESDHPSPLRRVFAALSLGVSLLFRSALVFFPPVFAAYERAASPPSKRPSWAAVFALALLPYLVLIPWLRYGIEFHRRFVPLENHQADSNVVTGALGLTGTVEGPWRRLMDAPPGALPAGGVYAWALRQILRRPPRFAAAVGRRLGIVANYHPFLLTAALLGLLLGRRQKSVGALSLLAVYFVGIHCLMSIQSAYFAPLWPLLGLIAGLGAARALGGATSPSRFDAAARKSAAALCLVLLALAAASAAGVEALIGTGMNASARRRPGDWWTLFERGRDEAAAGRPLKAASLLNASFRLNPRCEPCAVYAAWAEALSGDPSSLDRAPRPEDLDLRVILDVMRGYSLSTRGKTAAAGAAMRQALADDEAKHVVRYARAAAAAPLTRRLNSFSMFSSACLGIVRGASPGPMIGLLRDLAGRKGVAAPDPEGLAPDELCPYYQQ